MVPRSGLALSRNMNTTIPRTLESYIYAASPLRFSYLRWMLSSPWTVLKSLSFAKLINFTPPPPSLYQRTGFMRRMKVVIILRPSFRFLRNSYLHPPPPPTPDTLVYLCRIGVITVRILAELLPLGGKIGVFLVSDFRFFQEICEVRPNTTSSLFPTVLKGYSMNCSS